MKERINFDNLTLILKSWDLLQKNKYSLWTNDEGDFKHKGLLNILNRYMSDISKCKDSEIGLKQVHYEPSVKKSLTRGRIYPKDSCGIIAFPKYIRNFCLIDKKGVPLVIDIDIVNAHPVFFYHVMQKEDYPLEDLKTFRDYLDNRADWIEEFGSEIKNQVICVLNCSESIRYSDSKVESLACELWKAQKWLMKKHNLKDMSAIKEFIYNANCKMERDIIENAFEYVRKLGIEPEIYAYDGFCIPNSKEFQKDPSKVVEFLSGLNAHIAKDIAVDMPQIRFVSKPIVNDHKLIDILKDADKSIQLENCNKVTLEKNKFIGDIFNGKNILDFKDYAEDVIVFKGPMGDGKTFYIYNCIKKLRDIEGSSVTTISILNRVSLVGNVCFDYPFVSSYLERQKDETLLHGIGRATAICCESLHRFTAQTLQKCDYLILDEFMSILTQLQSVGTHKGNLSTNQNIFWGLVRNVKKVIIMDANIERQTIDFIKFIRRGGSVLSYEIAPRKDKEIIFTEEDQMIPYLEKSASEGKRFAIPITRNIQYGDAIKSKLESTGAKVLYINQTTKEQYAEYISDTTKWTEYDIIMYSPTISSGVSCTVENHFDFVACFFSGNTSNPYESSQMIGRVRYPKTNKIYINLNLSTPHPIYNKNPMNRSELVKHLYLNQYELYNKHKLELDKKFNFETFREEIVHNERMELFLHTTEFQLFQYKSFKFFLETALKNSYNCTFTEANEVELKQWNTEEAVEFKEQIEQNQLINAQNILNARTLTKSEANEMEVEMKTNTFEYKKYQIVSKSRIPDFQGWMKHKIENGHDHKDIIKIVESFIAPTVKKLYKIFKSQKTTDDALSINEKMEQAGVYNPLELDEFFESNPHMESDIQFNSLFYNALFDQELSAKDCIDLWRGTLVKVQYAEFVLKKFFGSKFLWEQITLTNDEFKKAQFELYKFIYNPKNKVKHGGDFKYTIKKRFEMLFNMHLTGKPVGEGDDYKTFFEKNTETKIAKNKPIPLESILECCNLVFKQVGKRKQTRVDGKRVEIPRDYMLQMNCQVILDDRYPHKFNIVSPTGEIKSRAATPEEQKLIPVVMSDSLQLTPRETDVELYKSSVFYNLNIIEK